jgi:hypothetical protein
VLSVNSAADATEALENVLPALAPHALWAELNTSPPETKVRLAATVRRAKRRFVDVALMSPVPGLGISCPMLTSGEGAQDLADLLAPLGARIEVVVDRPGDASTRKLLRSIFYKGMAAAILEALAGARASGLETWLLPISPKSSSEWDLRPLTAWSTESIDTPADALRKCLRLPSWLEELRVSPWDFTRERQRLDRAGCEISHRRAKGRKTPSRIRRPVFTARTSRRACTLNTESRTKDLSRPCSPQQSQSGAANVVNIAAKSVRIVARRASMERVIRDH